MSKCRALLSAAVLGCSLALSLGGFAEQAETETPIENAFQLGLIVQDTNGDKLADAVCGHVVVTSSSTAAENTAAANLAARIGYETTALTLPIVVQGSVQPGKGCAAEKATLWVGRAALTASAAVADKETEEFQIGEGGVFTVPGGLVFVGADSAGLLAAANAYSAHAPYQWSTTGEKLQGIARTINERLTAQKVPAKVELVGVTYQSGQPGIQRIVLQVTGSADRSAVQKALTSAEGEPPLKNVHAREVKLLLTDGAPLLLGGGGNGTGVTATAASSAPASGEEDEDEGEPFLLDLHQLYGIQGLLKGNKKKLVPESVAAKLYVPAGEAGIQMANLAARMGLETTGITFPIAFPATGASPVGITSPVVIAGNSQLTEHAKDILGAPEGTAMDKLVPGQFGKDGAAGLPTLKKGEGELRVVDRAFGKNPALLVRGDAAGEAAALQYAAAHLPYLWEPSKKFAGLEEMRLDLAQFFSMRSSTGQATAALFDLDQWMNAIVADGKKVTSATAELDVDEADPKLANFVRNAIAEKLKTARVEVKTGSLHAGTKCCAADPDLHNVSLVVPFKQAEPTFRDDFTIPWEGKRLMEAMQGAVAQMPKGQPVTLEVRVSESPEERIIIKQRLVAMLQQAGAPQADVAVLCSYKSGYSWLVDQIEPMVKDKGVARLQIEFAPYPDPGKQTTMRSLYRWNQELFPVD